MDGRADIASTIDVEVGPSRQRARPSYYLVEVPLRTVDIYPLREVPMPDMGGSIASDLIRRIDNYISLTRTKEVPHVSIEGLVLYQMVDDIQRDGRVGGEHTQMVDK